MSEEAKNWNSDIKELGDKIVALTLLQAKELGDYLKKAAPNAIVRSGDYPVGRGIMEVTVILSRLSDLARVRYFYTRSLE